MKTKFLRNRKDIKKTFIVRLIIFCGFALLCYSCKEKGRCPEVKIPENLSPIDWENYNDVYTVYWNCKKGIEKNSHTENIIKVTGWILQPGANIHEINPARFYLTDGPDRILFSEGLQVNIISFETAELLKIKFGNSDLTKKCYITGNLFGLSNSSNDCSWIDYMIEITNPDDIYFE